MPALGRCLENTMPYEMEWESVEHMLASGMDQNTRIQWEETGSHRDVVPIDVDWDKYASLQKAGVFHLLSLRKDGKLIGHAAFFMAPHTMYRTTIHVFCDSIFILPGFRARAVHMIRKAERYFSEKIGKPFRIIYFAPIDGKLPKVLEHLGYPAAEFVHTKLVVVS